MRVFYFALLAVTYSAAVLAQDAAQSSSAEMSNGAPDAASTITGSESADRVEAECRDWALQDGVPETELAEYVKDCVEDRAVQE